MIIQNANAHRSAEHDAFVDRAAVVEVALRDGTRFSERVEAVRGTVRNPMDRDEVVAKAVISSRRCWEARRRAA